MPSLVFEFDDGSRIVAPIAGRATIGSGHDNDVVAEREDVSEHHAEIFITDDGSAWLRDLGSVGGTFINGERVQSHRLTLGDRVAFGSVAALFSPEMPVEHHQDVAGTALRDLEARLAESQARHEALLKSVSEASDRSHMLNDRVHMLSNQERTKLENMERLHRDVAELEATHAATRAETDELEKKRARLKEEVATLTDRTAEAKTGTELAEKDHALAKDTLAKTAAELESTKSALAATASQHSTVKAELDAAKVEHARLKSESESHVIRADQARVEAEQHAATKDQLAKVNEDLRRQVEEVSRRLADLSGTEEHLLKARGELHETRATHDTLTKALADVTTQRDATYDESTRLAAYLDELREQYGWFEQAIPSVHEQHAQADKHLREFETAAAQSRDSWNAKIGALQQSATTEQTGLSIVRQEVETARSVLAGLEARSRELEAASAGLAVVQARLAEAKSEKDKLDAQVAKLEKSCTDSKESLAALESAEKDATGRVTGLRGTESDLLKTLQSLSADQQRERAKFDELKKAADEAEKEGVRKKTEFEARIAELHAEVAALESRLAHAREWNAEIDERYARLAAMTDDSPEGLALWKETQVRRKEIAEQLPSGIQVRAQGRTRVVPRGR